MFTSAQSGFRLNYIDPETHSMRNYYLDILKAKNMMDDPDVRTKQEFAETMLKVSRIKSHMIPHIEAAGW